VPDLPVKKTNNIRYCAAVLARFPPLTTNLRPRNPVMQLFDGPFCFLDLFAFAQTRNLSSVGMAIAHDFAFMHMATPLNNSKRSLSVASKDSFLRIDAVK